MRLDQDLGGEIDLTTGPAVGAAPEQLVRIAAQLLDGGEQVVLGQA